jgi:hypothetical protein
VLGQREGNTLWHLVLRFVLPMLLARSPTFHFKQYFGMLAKCWCVGSVCAVV